LAYSCDLIWHNRLELDFFQLKVQLQYSEFSILIFLLYFWQSFTNRIDHEYS
jgi:hypothetical protein